MQHNTLSQEEFDTIIQAPAPRKPWTQERQAAWLLGIGAAMVGIGYLWMWGTSTLQADYQIAYGVAVLGSISIGVVVLWWVIRELARSWKAGTLQYLILGVATALTFIGGMSGAFMSTTIFQQIASGVSLLMSSVLFVGLVGLNVLIQIRNLLQAQHDRAEAHATHQAPRP